MLPLRILAAVLAAECARACAAFAVPSQFSDVAPRAAPIDWPLAVASTFAAGSARGDEFKIDGWNETCGDPAPCQLAAPPNVRHEGEPDCHEGVYDTYNGGCNDYPYAFTTIECGDSTIVVEGNYGTYAYYDEDFRDTDWYRIDLHQPGILDCSVVGGAPTQLAILDGREGCEGWSTICGSVLGEACEPIDCQATLEPGTYFIFVATRCYAGVRCGTQYLLSVRGHRCPPIAVRAATWGEVKERYR